MRQRFTLLIMMALTLLAARAGSVKLFIDHPEHVDITWNYASVQDFTDGMVFTSDNYYTSLVLEPKDDYTLTRAEVSNGNTLSTDNGTLYIRPGDYTDEVSVHVEVRSLEEARSASLILTVDEPEMLNIARNSNRYGYLELQPGENTVKFIPDTDSPFLIKARNYNGMIYKVTVDDEEFQIQENSSGQYCEVPVKDGSRLNVVYRYPQQECTVNVVLPEGVGTDLFKSVFVSRDDQREDLLPDTEYVLDAGSYLNLEINKDKYLLESISLNGKDYYDQWTSTYRLPVTEKENSLTISGHPYADINAILNLTDPSHVTVYAGDTYSGTPIEGLQAGENKIAVSEKIGSITINATDRAYIKSITDADDNTYREGYSINLASDGSSVITVVSEAYSDEPVTVTVNIPEGFDFEDFIKGVKINGKLTQLSGNSFEALPGSTVCPVVNIYDYDLTAATFTKEGDEAATDVLGWVGLDDVKLIAGGTYDIEANKKEPTFSFTIDIDDPEAVSLYRYYSSYTAAADLWTLSGLQPGENTVTWAVTNYYSDLTVIANDGYILKGFVNAEDGSELGKTNCTVSDGMKIKITTEKIARDARAVIYISDAENFTANWSYITINTALSTIPAPYLSGYKDGYAVIEFSTETENPFYFNVNPGYSSSVTVPADAVLLNDVALENETETGFEARNVELHDGDVVRIHTTGHPEKCNVTFQTISKVARDAEESFYTVTRDILLPVDASSDLSVFKGTRFDITPLEGKAIAVTVNDVPVNEENGSFIFTADDDAAVTVSDMTDAVDTIGAEAADRFDVFNIQGIRVLRDADADMIKRLPAGIYIFGGKKVVVK